LIAKTDFTLFIMSIKITNGFDKQELL